MMGHNMDTLVLYGSNSQVALYLLFESYLLDCFGLSLSLPLLVAFSVSLFVHVWIRGGIR